MSKELGEPSYGLTYPTILQGQSRSYQDGAKHVVTGLAGGGIGGLPAGEYPAVKVGQTLPSRHVSERTAECGAGGGLLVV
jgi:hypothetical protein